MEPSKTALVGALIGGGAGAALGVALGGCGTTSGYGPCLGRGETGAEFGGVGAAVGALIGFCFRIITRISSTECDRNTRGSYSWLAIA